MLSCANTIVREVSWVKRSGTGGLQRECPRVGKHASYRACRGGGGAGQDGACTLALAPLEIAVACGHRELPRRDEITVHGDAHGAAGQAPFGAGLYKHA